MDSKILDRHNYIFLFMILISLTIAAPEFLLTDTPVIHIQILYLLLLLGPVILLAIHARSDIVKRASYFLILYRNRSYSYRLFLLMLSCLLWSIFILLPIWHIGKSSATQLGYIALSISVLTYLYLGGRRIHVKMDRTIMLLIASLLVMIPFSLFYPVMYEARGKNWDDTLASLGKSQQELTYLERFYQLNTDIPAWIAIAASFPYHYYTDKVRINRPVYPAILSTFCRVAEGLKHYPKGSTQNCGKQTVFVMGFLVNTFLTILTIILWVKLLRWYIANEAVIFLGGLAMVTSAHILWSLPQPSTKLIGLSIVVITAWIFAKILQSPHLPFTLLIIYSLTYGILMLAKSNYSILMIFLLIGVFFRHKWVSILLFIVLHFIPLLAWVAVLEKFGLAYYNHEVATYGQGIWIFEDFIYRDRRQMYHDVVGHLGVFASSGIFSFGPLTLILLAFAVVKPSIAAGHRWVVVATVAGVATFTFLIRRAPPFLVFDGFFAVLPAVAVGLWELTELLQRRMTQILRYKTGMIAAVIVILVNNLIVILASDPQFNLGGP